MNKKQKTGLFWQLWTSYATYYFGKVNLGIIIPALLATYQNLSLYNVGLVSSGFFFAYAIGQFLHGQISERHNPYVYASLGLILSGIVNLFLGFWAGFFIILLTFETLDGFVQAMGWSSIVRANSGIQSKKNLSKSSTILGCSYQFGNAIAWLISAFVVGAWGWRAGFFVASGFLIFRGITLYFIRPKKQFKPKQKIKKQIKLTLSRKIVLSGISLLFVNMVRYGVLTWIPLYFFLAGNFEVAEMGKVGLKVFLIPLAGILGTLIYNKIPMKKDWISVIFLFLMGITWIFFPFVGGITSTILLLLGSAFLYGSHVFLVSTVPTRFKDKNIVASSTGFIDGMGYIGTILIGLIVPFIILEGGGWNNVFLFWAGLSFIASFSVIINLKKWKQ